MIVLEEQRRAERKCWEEEKQGLQREMDAQMEREKAKLERCQQEWEGQIERQKEEVRGLVQQCAADAEAG